MRLRVQYHDEAERETLLQEHPQTLYFVGEENLFEGNFLIFSDTLDTNEPRIVYTQVNAEEYNDLKTGTADLELALTELLTGGM